MPLHLNPKVKGKYIKLGEAGWVKLNEIKKPKIVNGELVIDKKDGTGSIVYKGKMLDHVKQVLDKETTP